MNSYGRFMLFMSCVYDRVGFCFFFLEIDHVALASAGRAGDCIWPG